MGSRTCVHRTWELLSQKTKEVTICSFTFLNEFQIEVKATSDVKHATDTLNAEKKKQRQLQKNHTDVCYSSYFLSKIKF